MGINLEAEFCTATANVKQPHLNRLASLGVRPSDVAFIGAYHPPFGIMSGTPTDDGTFENGDGPAHIVQPVVSNGYLIDLVAWRSTNPGRWWLRTGLGWLLNADACLASRWDGESLVLHSTPLDWLRAAGQGGVVVDWDSPDLIQLRGFADIHCDDAKLATTLGHALVRKRHQPRISVQEVRHAA